MILPILLSVLAGSAVAQIVTAKRRMEHLDDAREEYGRGVLEMVGSEEARAKILSLKADFDRRSQDRARAFARVQVGTAVFVLILVIAVWWMSVRGRP